ncbi:hypothetical protein Tco_0442961 [Tanacetum coccineum]
MVSARCQNIPNQTVFELPVEHRSEQAVNFLATPSTGAIQWPSKTAKFEDALAHPYLTSLHDISDEPVCMTPFNFDFEHHAPTEEQMKEMIYREALAFNPEYAHL